MNLGSLGLPPQRWQVIFTFLLKMLFIFGSPLTYLINLAIIVWFLQFNIKFWGFNFLNDTPAAKTVKKKLRPKKCAGPE